MLEFYANPYSIDLSGFYFKSLEEYETKLAQAKRKDPSGDFEHSIELIDGSNFAVAAFEALSGSDGLSPAQIEDFFEIVDEFDDEDESLALLMRAKDVYNTKSAMELRDAMDESRDSLVGETSLVDYAYELVSEQGTSSFSGDYFDYASFGRDFLLNWSGEGVDEEEDEREYEELERMSDYARGVYVIEEMYGGLENLSPRNLELFFDHDAFARDLGFDHSEYTLPDGTVYLFHDN